MTYSEVTTIVDGAVDEEATFFDYLLQDKYIEEVKADALGHGYPTDIFVMYHEHDPSECECIQDLHDYSPLWSSEES